MLAELARSYDVSRSTISSLRHRDSRRAKVHDLGRYLELIVEPTFDEFKKNRASVRHAFLTCVAIYHAIDRASYPNKPGNLRKEWGKQSLEFKLVDIIAHHFKHVHSSDEIIGIRRPGLPISRALGFNDAGDQMDLRNLFFVIRDAMKFCTSKLA